MDEVKLIKRHERLYHLHDGKRRKPFVWAKRLNEFSLTLPNIRITHSLSILRPETSPSALLKPYWQVEGDQKAGQQETTTLGGDETQQNYSEYVGWQISSTGIIQGIARIGVIRKDGTFTGRAESCDRMNVILLPISGADNQKADSSLWFTDIKEPYLMLHLLVPETQFNKIISGHFSEIEVRVYVDVFQSEEHRNGLSQPNSYIEEDGIRNRAYLSSLTTSRSVTIENSGATDTNETLRLINQQLTRIRIVGILVAIALFLVLLVK